MNTIESLIEDNRHQGDTPLRQAQLVMLRLLRIVDYICRTHNLRYWLDSGTLLGAVRHKGFIPWDDDIDICMPREDYEEFIKFFNKYQFRTIEIELRGASKNSAGNIVPCKIRDLYSIIAEPSSTCERGIFIDIFPYDKFHSAGRATVWWERGLKQCYKAIVKLKESKYYKKDSPSRRFLGLFHYLWVAIFRLYLKIIVPQINRSRTLEGIDVMWGFGYDVPFCWYFLESDIFPLKEISFENHCFYAPSDYAKFLVRFYGLSYMNLPPEDKRISHAVKIIPDTRQSM